MNLYEKIQCIKEELLKANLKKSGNNEFAGYTYYELGDFIPTIVTKCKEYKILTYFSFDNDFAKLIAVNAENPEEKIETTSPMKDIQIKSCNDIQALGGTETYQRRYLYMALFDIVENDMFDGGKVPVAVDEELEKAKKEVTDFMGKVIKSGVSKDEVYALVSEVSGGKKNPKSFKDKETCNKVLATLKEKFKGE